MKKSIIDAIKLKYANLGLSDKTIEGVADMLAATTQKEEDIDTAVSGVGNLLKTFQSDADKRVQDALAKAKKEKKAEPSQASTPTGTEGTGTGDAGTSTDGKGNTSDGNEKVLSALEQLTNRLAALEQGKTLSNRRSVLSDKLKEVNPAIKKQIMKQFEHMSFKDDEAFDNYMTETMTDVEELSRALVDETLKGGNGRPFVPNAGTEKKASDEELDAIVNEII